MEKLPLSLPEYETDTSNLSPELQGFVRTPEFKEWFGDWENDPDNASKVVDENGEPLLVYAGLPAGIEELNNNNRLHTGSDETGYYFTARRTNARAMAQQRRDPVTDEIVPSSVYSAFLNAPNLYTVRQGDGVKTTRVLEQDIPPGVDGYKNDKLSEYVVFSPDQVLIMSEDRVN